MLRRGAIATAVVAVAVLTSLTTDAGAISLSCSLSERTGVLEVVDSRNETTLIVLGGPADASGVGAQYKTSYPQSPTPSKASFGCEFDGAQARTNSVLLGDGDDVVKTDGKEFLNNEPVEDFGPVPAAITLSLDGGPGNDRMIGHVGRSIIRGGTGNDRITDIGGADKIDGGPGNDRIDARDGRRDLIDCGGGDDEIIADPKDELEHC